MRILLINILKTKTISVHGTNNILNRIAPFALNKNIADNHACNKKIRHYSGMPDSNEQKNFENQPRRRERSLPKLMMIPEIIWPSAIKTIKNWITIHFIIRPYFDNEFFLKDFVFGTKRALQVISSKLVNGDMNGLTNLLSNNTIAELTPVVQGLSIAQRRQLEVMDSDIYLTFPYEIGIIFDESNEKLQRRFVEITMVFHVLRGFTEMKERGEEIPWNMGTLPEYQDRVFVCNYRFLKEFTTGHHSDWTVNALNHFKPIDIVHEHEN